MKHFLTKYLNSVAVFDGPNDQGSDKSDKDEKTEAQKQREAIKVETSEASNNKDKDVNEGEDKEEDEEEDENEEEDNEEEENNENETDEQRTARIAQEKEDRRQARVQKRIDKLTALNANKDNEIAELKKQLAEKPVEGLTEEEVERRAAKKAEELAAAKEADRQQKAFEKATVDLVKSATKIDKDFEKKIMDVAKETDVLMPPYMVEILSDLDNENGDEILAQLANDADMYEEICTLSERKMTQRLIRMSDKIKDAKKGNGAGKQAQRRPDPPEPIEPINDGVNNRGNSLPSKPTQNMEDFVRIRNKQQEEYNKARGRF